MPKSSASRLTDVAQRAADGLQQAVPRLAARLAPEVQQAGAKKLTKSEYLALWHRNWTDQHFRMAMLAQVGPKAFEETANEMVTMYGNPLPPPMPVVPMGIPSVGGAPPVPLPPYPPQDVAPTAQPTNQLFTPGAMGGT